MSRFKLMYDVINTMKDKEVLTGTLEVEGIKDEAKIFDFKNEFQKNLSNGETKTKISSELDYNGKKFKHESQTEFTMPCCHGHKHHSFIRHMHRHYHRPGVDESLGEKKCTGIKEKLTRVAFLLNLFNQIKVDEKEDKSVILSLNFNEIPDDMKKVFQERMCQRAMPESHKHHSFMKEFYMLKEPEIEVKLWISKTRDVERIMVTVDGKQIDETDRIHNLKLTAELQLIK